MEHENKDGRTTTSFNIIGIPTKEFERFLRFCDENSTVTKIYEEEGKRKIKQQQWYAGAIKMLLDIAESDGKHQALYDELVRQKREIDLIKADIKLLKEGK
jgi:hypothetical protein